MHELTHWLQSFFSKRHLATPDRRPIYEYHFSREDFESLQSALCAVTAFPRRQLDISIDFQRALFLYAVMWVSFTFKDGAPRWDDIFSSINLPAKVSNLRAAEADLVIKGAAYFHKKPQIDGHKNIGLIFSQAGFPIAALADASSTLTRRLQDVMAFDSLNHPTDEQLLYYIHGLELPQGYDEETVAQSLLTGSRCFNAIIASYRKDGAAGIQKLHSKFRDEFPAGCISLEEFTKLLSDYQKAVEEKRRLAPTIQSEAFSINRYLFVDGASLNLRTAVTLRPGTDPERIAKFFSFAVPQGQGTLGTVAANGKPLLFVSTGNGAFRIVKSNKLRFDGDAALQSVDLTFTCSGRQYNAAAPLNNAAQLQKNEVHSFVQSPDEDPRKWFYLGSGSLCTKALHVLAMIPASWDRSQLPEDAFLGECLGFAVCRIEADLTLTDPEDGCEFSLTLGQESKNTPQYMLAGPLIGHAVDDTPIYRGLPVVYRYSAGSAVRSSDIAWLDAGSRAWTESHGAERLKGRLRDNGRVVKRFNIIATPESADIKATPVTNRQTGEIRLVNWGLFSASLEDEYALLCSTWQDKQDSVISFPPSTTRGKDHVLLDCQTQSGAHFELRQVLPVQRTDFLLNGRPMDSLDELSLTAAESLSARVIDMNPHSASHYLEIRPASKYRQQEFHTAIPFTFVGNSKEATLTFGDDMAQAVQRTLRLAGSIGITLAIPPGQHLTLQRHQTRLELAETDGLFSVITAGSKAGGTTPDIVAIPLFNPEKEEPVLLSHEVETGAVTLPLDMKLDETTVWMLCRRSDDAFSTQPTFFAGLRNPRSLIKLSTILDLWMNDDRFRRDSRLRERVRDVVQELIRHPEDSDWAALESIRQRTSVKGLARLPLWQALSDSVDTAFTLAILLDLRTGDQSHFLFNEVSKVQNWRWELNHLDSLRESIRQALQHMKTLIPVTDDAVFAGLFSHLLESRYFQHHPAFEAKLKLALLMNGLLDPNKCHELLPIASLFSQPKISDPAGRLRALWQQEAQASSGLVVRDNFLDRKANLALSLYQPIVSQHFPALHQLIQNSGVLNISDPMLTAIFVGLAAWEAAGCKDSVDAKKALAAAEPYFLLETLMSVSPQWTLACEKLAIAAAFLIAKNH